LKFIGGKGDIEGRKPVIGKGGKGGSSRPNAIPEFFSQYAIGGGGRSRFLENVSELGGWVLGRSGMGLPEEEVLRSFCGKKEQPKGMVSGCSGIGVHGLDITGGAATDRQRREVR